MHYGNLPALKTENFKLNFFLYFFLIFDQKIDCGYTLEPLWQGGPNEYPQSMFRSKNKKNRYTPAYPSFTMQKWGLRGYLVHGHVLLMATIFIMFIICYMYLFQGRILNRPTVALKSTEMSEKQALIQDE